MRPSLERNASIFIALTLLSGCSALVDPDTSRLDDPSRLDAGPRRDGATIDAPGVPCDLDCDDGIACTIDRCLDDACVHQPDDGVCGGPGDVCVGTAICDPARGASGSGCVFAAPLVCDDGIACTRDECDPVAGRCRSEPQHAACDDGVDCTVDRCDAGGGGDGCTHIADDSVCDDGFCRTGGRCDPARGCTGGAPRDCSDGSRCTEDRCDEARAMCVHIAIDADGDGFPAQRVMGETCAGGTDCDDARASVHPGATEVCSNMVDEDCDGVPDDGCSTCRAMPSVCPTGWTYSNDGREHRCSVTFAPPLGVREYCLFADDGVLGFYWMHGAPYSCPTGARYAPNPTYGYCLWERVAVPAAATVDCSGVGGGRMSFRWPC